MNFTRIIGHVDTFERATVLFIIVALVVLPAISRWLSDHDDESDGQRAAVFLAGLTAVGTLLVIVAAILGPHPA